MRSLVLLALIAFLPFPVRLLSDYHNQPAAVAIYMGTFTLAAARWPRWRWPRWPPRSRRARSPAWGRACC